MAGKPALLKALETLKMAVDGDTQSLEPAFNNCRSAANDIHYAHVLYSEIADIANNLHWYETAEEFAVRTLKQLPSSGSALKALGKALQGQGRLADAAICHRYGLPKTLRDKYFGTPPIKQISYINADNVRTLPAYPVQHMPLNPPVSLSDEPIFELSLKQLRSSPANTFHLNKARLWFDGFNTVVWDEHANVISEISRGLPEVVSSAVERHKLIQLTGKTCVLGNRNSQNYYHWMNDIVPRLHVLDKSGIALDSIDQFIINPLRHAFQIETLNQFDINESRLCVAGDKHYFACEELYFPDYGSNTLGKGQASWNPMFLKSAFLKHHSHTHDTRLYISRESKQGRSVQNEDQLFDFLNQRGFVRVILEELTIQEQASLFNKASVVIGAHGAGLSNTVFCQPDTTVIELYKDHIVPCFWIVSEQTGLRHAVHFCGDEQQEDFTPGDEQYHESADYRRLSDFDVDLIRLNQLLVKLNIH